MLQEEVRKLSKNDAQFASFIQRLSSKPSGRAHEVACSKLKKFFSDDRGYYGDGMRAVVLCLEAGIDTYLGEINQGSQPNLTPFIELVGTITSKIHHFRNYPSLEERVVNIANQLQALIAPTSQPLFSIGNVQISLGNHYGTLATDVPAKNYPGNVDNAIKATLSREPLPDIGTREEAKDEPVEIVLEMPIPPTTITPSERPLGFVALENNPAMTTDPASKDHNPEETGVPSIGQSTPAEAVVILTTECAIAPTSALPGQSHEVVNDDNVDALVTSPIPETFGVEDTDGIRIVQTLPEEEQLTMAVESSQPPNDVFLGGAEHEMPMQEESVLAIDTPYITVEQDVEMVDVHEPSVQQEEATSSLPQPLSWTQLDNLENPPFPMSDVTEKHNGADEPGRDRIAEVPQSPVPPEQLIELEPGEVDGGMSIDNPPGSTRNPSPHEDTQDSAATKGASVLLRYDSTLDNDLNASFFVDNIQDFSFRIKCIAQSQEPLGAFWAILNGSNTYLLPGTEKGGEGQDSVALDVSSAVTAGPNNIRWFGLRHALANQSVFALEMVPHVAV